jgi:hypothetical protein
VSPRPDGSDAGSGGGVADGVVGCAVVVAAGCGCGEDVAADGRCEAPVDAGAPEVDAGTVTV